MTPLERPRDLAAKAVLTPAEAGEYERRTIARQGDTNNTAGPDWWDPGTRHPQPTAAPRSIVDPPDGRLPPLTAEAQARNAARAKARPRGAADGPEDRALNERCLAGPPPVRRCSRASTTTTSRSSRPATTS